MTDRSHADDRIAEDSKIRSRAYAIDWIRGPAVAVPAMSQRHRRKVATSRGTHHSDSLGIDLPLLRVESNCPYGSLDVEQFHRIPIAIRTEAVLEDKGGHSDTVQEQGEGATL